MSLEQLTLPAAGKHVSATPCKELAPASSRKRHHSGGRGGGTWAVGIGAKPRLLVGMTSGWKTPGQGRSVQTRSWIPSRQAYAAAERRGVLEGKERQCMQCVRC